MIGDDFNLIKAYEAVPGRIYDVALQRRRQPVRRRQQPRRHGRSARLRNRQRQAAAQARRPARARCTPWPSARAARSWRRPASTALVRLNDAETGKLIKEFTPVPAGADESRRSGQVVESDTIR